MNWAHIHIAINHLPVIGSIFAFFLLAFAAVRKSEDIRRLSLAFCVLIALAAIPVFLTGEPAEEVVEHFAGVSETIIEEHEESALPSLIAVEILGIVALAGLILYRGEKRIPKRLLAASLALSIIVVGLMGWTANLGGQIRHQEARSGFSASTASEQPEGKTLYHQEELEAEEGEHE